MIAGAVPERCSNALGVIGIAHAQDVPAVSQKAHGDVFGEGDVGVPFDRDAVVVVDPAEVVEPQVAGERCGFRSDAFHHAAVPGDRINPVVEDREARAVVAIGQPFFRDGHPHTCCDTLSQRTGGGLNAGHPVVLGMARRFAIELAEAADIFERDGGVAEILVVPVHRLSAREVQDRPEQHR